MTGFIKLKGKIRETPIQVSDEVAKGISAIKFGNPNKGIPPCESSKLLDLGIEVFQGTYGDVANVWIEADRPKEAPATDLTKQEIVMQAEAIKKHFPSDNRPDYAKVKRIIPPEELHRSEEELKQFSVSEQLEVIKENNL